MNNFPNAEDINYWKTGKSTPDTWLDKAEKVINDLGGEVVLRALGKVEDRSGFLMDFKFGDEKFRAVWPVLPVKNDKDIKAAERQAATMLFYDVKSRSIRAAVFGVRNAFFDFILLENNHTVSQLSNEMLIEYTPKLLT